MTQSIELQIKGMTCASCVSRLERVLKKDPHVQSASVNLATERARIEYDSKQLNLEGLKALVTKAGYEASLPEPRKKHDLSSERRQIWIASILTAPLVLPMLLMPFGIHLMPTAWLQLALATPVQFWIGWRFYKGAFSALKAKSANMDVLVAIGTSAAYGLSLYHMRLGSMHLYFESSAVIITLVLFGKYLEARAKEQTSQAISALESLRPDKARVLREGVEVEIPLESLRLQDTVIIKPGERIPADGEILQGSTHVDESLITGESQAQERRVGDKLIAGSINGEGVVHLKVKAIGAESTLSKIIRMVEDAQAVKAPIQRLVDRVSEVFVPTVLVLALLTFILTGSMINAIAVLVIACPCALGLATPTSIMVGTGRAAKSGILIKDAEALELTHRLDILAFDKTGTLTEGKPSLSFLQAFDGTKSEALRMAAALQSGSEHPLAQAILKARTEKKIEYTSASDVKAISGKGLSGVIEGKTYLLGSYKLLESLDSETLNKERQERAEFGESLSYLINETDKKVLALFGFTDQIKESAQETIRELKKLGVKPVMLTGDNRGSASRVAKQLGIEDYRAELMPQDKFDLIREFKQSGKVVGMVGDGINDAPALASADVAFAMATGTDVAMHSSGVTLMQGDPRLIVDAISLSKATYRKIQQNLFWAFVYNVIGIPLAALGYLNPMLAGAAMALSSVSVVTNSLMLKNWKGVKR